MTFTVKELARRISAEVRGDGSLAITGGQSLSKSREGDITFVADERNARDLSSCQASALLVGKNLSESPRLSDFPNAILIVPDAKLAFLKILETLYPPHRRPAIGVSSLATVHPSARVGRDTNIHPGVHIAEDVIIGEHCDLHPGVCVGPGCRIADHTVLYSNVVLYHDVVLGERVIIHAGAVIGADGFGYLLVEGRHQKLPHFGTVRIEDDVEIGANTTIDRALVGETVIGEGTKIDNLVQIAHNCELGKHNILAGLVAFAGSVTTGEYLVCAGQVGIADHVHVGERAILAAQAGVSKSLPGDNTYFGSPAQLLEETKVQVIAMRKLPKMREQIRELTAGVKSLQTQMERLMPRSDVADDDPAESASAA